MRFSAPTLQYFLDSPTELSDFSERRWTVKWQRAGRPTFDWSCITTAREEDVDKYLEMAKGYCRCTDRNIRRVTAFRLRNLHVYCRLPALCFRRRNGAPQFYHSCEHAISCWMHDFAQKGTLSHEFIHAWNVERIRPASLEPFDFERANMSAESVVCRRLYILLWRPGDSQAPVRSSSGEELCRQSLPTPINTVSHSPGRRFRLSARNEYAGALCRCGLCNRSDKFREYLHFVLHLWLRRWVWRSTFRLRAEL